MGLLDILNTPAGMGLLSAVAGGMAGARRGQPINSIGRGLAAGAMGYTQSLEDQRRQQAVSVADQYRQMQMDQMRQTMEQQKAQQGWKAGLPAALNATKEQRTTFEADNPFGENLGTLQNTAQVPDMQARQDYLMHPDSPYADKLIEQQIMPPETVVVGRTLKNKRTGETIGHDETWKEEQSATRQQRIEELQMRLA